VGLLSGKTRLVRVKNVLTEQEDAMEVPSEETVGQVRPTTRRAPAAALQAQFMRAVQVFKLSRQWAPSCVIEAAHKP
jgi:hypothetical protein